ncbi:MAG: hypothetical protein HOV79_26665 [Hamadaea sp.]|nr:hypothetical protein [Hamadaea sp.]
MTSGALDGSYQLPEDDSEDLAARRRAREELDQYVDLTHLPVTAGVLRGQAQDNGAPPEVLRRLAELDPELEIRDKTALWRALSYEPRPSL